MLSFHKDTKFIPEKTFKLIKIPIKYNSFSEIPFSRNFIHLLYLFAYYPAIIGHDVWDQFSQLQRNNYNDWHPVAHTIYLKIVTWICDT